MRAGRSRASVMLLARPSLHMFVWAPWTGADSFGVTVRWRAGRGWTHWRLIVFQRNGAGHSRMRKSPRVREGKLTGRLFLRRTLTVFELARWKTAPGTKDRVGTKGYVRVKVGWPGTAVA